MGVFNIGMAFFAYCRWTCKGPYAWRNIMKHLSFVDSWCISLAMASKDVSQHLVLMLTCEGCLKIGTPRSRFLIIWKISFPSRMATNLGVSPFFFAGKTSGLLYVVVYPKKYLIQSSWHSNSMFKISEIQTNMLYPHYISPDTKVEIH